MTTTYDWHSTYRNAVEAFGGTTPGPELEQQLLEAFQHSPQTIVAAIAKTEHLFKQGKITSPWGIIRADLNRVSNQPNITITDTTSRERAIAQAEAWIRHSGLTLNQDEIIAHLFAPQATTATTEYLQQIELETRGNPGRPLYEGLLLASIRKTQTEGPQPIPNTGGPLAEHDTHALRQRMLQIWHDLQPTADQLEADALERATAWKQQQQRKQQAAALKQAHAELAAQQPEHDPLPL